MWRALGEDAGLLESQVPGRNVRGSAACARVSEVIALSSEWGLLLMAGTAPSEVVLNLDFLLR